MEKYIGIKIVQAEPEVKDGVDGYKIVYPDGYESWSPKEQFENAYLPLCGDDTRIVSPVIDSLIATINVSKIDPKTALVTSELTTGFTQYATAACVDPENYDAEVGTRIGMNEIKDRLWFAMGFVLQWGRYGLKKTRKSYGVDGPKEKES